MSGCISRRSLLTLLPGLVLAGCSGHGRVLGVAPEGSPVLLPAARDVASGTPVVVRGKMVER